MTVSVKIVIDDSIVATITYKPGFLVDVKVASPFLDNKTVWSLCHRENGQIDGELSEALDKYFNEWIFESRSDLFPQDTPRVGAAREHKSLFLAATRILEKDLTPNGYRFEISFE